MKNKKTHIAAFTILEAVITLVISSIIIAFVYQIYTGITLQFQQFEKTQDTMVNYNQFATVFSRDVNLAQQINKASNTSIELTINDEIVRYDFATTYAVRESVSIDTFYVAVEDVTWKPWAPTATSLNETIHLDINLLGREIDFFEKKRIDLATAINNELLNEY